MPFNAARHRTPCHAIARHAMPSHAMPCHRTPCHAMPCHAQNGHATACHGHRFVFRVRAINLEGPSPWGSESAPVGTEPALPDAPRAVTAEQVGTRSVVLHWLEPLFDGASAILLYEVNTSNTQCAATLLPVRPPLPVHPSIHPPTHPLRQSSMVGLQLSRYSSRCCRSPTPTGLRPRHSRLPR